MPVIRADNKVTIIVWTEESPVWNNVTLTRDAARRLVDGHRFFWNDNRTEEKLLWIGPVAELIGDAPSQSKPR